MTVKGMMTSKAHRPNQILDNTEVVVINRQCRYKNLEYVTRELKNIDNDNSSCLYLDILL